MSGWIAISRDLFKHEFFAREPMSEREAWVWMIAKAAWEDTQHRIGADMVHVPRGSFFCTLRELQSAWGWASDKRVRTFLRRTQEERMTEIKTDAGKTQVTICNYDAFQTDGRKKDAAGTQDRTQERRTKEQDNNTTKEEAKASSRKRGSRLSDDWFLPMDWGQWAVSEGMTEAEIRAESEKFKDYWMARAGPSAAKLDWQATWRNWVRTALERKPQLTAITGGRNERQRFDTAHREYTRRLAAGQIERGPDPSDPFGGR